MIKQGAIALTIAGSDSGGGAGIQADLKSFSALGAYGASVITALTAQNTCEVRAIHDIPANFITAQIRTVLDDLDVKAIKIGMVSRIDVINAIADVLSIRAHNIPIILDPVMVAKSGAHLLQNDAIDCLKERLIPQAHLLTPNLPEAAILLNRPMPTTAEDIIDTGQELLKFGPKAILMKGGHLPIATSVSANNICTDYLITANSSVVAFSAPHIDTPNTHGTGCTYSAAITALTAQGYPLNTAIEKAHDYLAKAIQQADQLSVGSGSTNSHGPVHHFHPFFNFNAL